MMHVLVTCMLRLYRLIISSISRILFGFGRYRGRFPGEIPDGDVSRGLSGQHEQCVHTILDIAGVRTSVSDSTLALTNPAFAVRDRMFLGDHDEPVPFWKVGLKKADFVMLDKWKMAYKKD